MFEDNKMGPPCELTVQIFLNLKLGIEQLVILTYFKELAFDFELLNHFILTE
jgi:hypothetical protein